MTRAERRRLAKKEAKAAKPAVYNITQAQLDESVRRVAEADLREQYNLGREDGLRDALVLMLALPMEVLIRDYWPDDFLDKMPGFVEAVLEMYEQWVNDEIDLEEIRSHLWEYGGIRLEQTEEGGD